MANPQKENGYTALANELVERLAKLDISGSESRVLLTIWRKTYGFQKKSDAISLSQFKDMTCLSVRTIIRATQDLEAKKMIYVDRVMDDGAKMTNVYHFVKDYDKWVVTNVSLQTDKNREGAKKRIAKKRASDKRVTTQKGSDKHTQKVVTNNAKKVNSLSHTKEKEITKERILAKTPDGVLQGKQWNELIDLFKPINPMWEDIYKNKTERGALEAMVQKFGFEKMKATLSALPDIVNRKYAPKITKPSELRRDFGKLLVFYKQETTPDVKKDSQVVDNFAKKS